MHVVDIWKASIAAELHTLQSRRKRWEVVLYPQRGWKNFFRGRFVFKVKMKNCLVDTYKSRLMFDGCRQVHGIDYTETFATVV